MLVILGVLAALILCGLLAMYIRRKKKDEGKKVDEEKNLLADDPESRGLQNVA